ncbi:MAG: serine/threonine-protein kinase [Myxococcota bacterium]|jgi:serine/threonine protein kinase|nr:serine/threonine-protein kinase [Myxococcota bacterium]
MSTVTPQNANALPRIIDERYELIELIGRGGFASVFRAKQLSIGREVAIKVLDTVTGATDNELREARFIRESQIASTLKHPNTVPIHDYGIEKQTRQPYLVMELLNGHDLHTELRQHGPLQPERAFKLLLGALDAIALGHESGIVHKDLKPSNLFIDQAGSARENLRVLDFGIARYTTRDEPSLSEGNIALGTDAYLAPEYISKKLVSPAIDVYQMALILVEMLTGSPLVRAESRFQYYLIHVEGKYVLPGWLERSELGALLKDALHKNHLLRLPNAAAFAERLAKLDPHTLCVESDDTSPHPQDAARPTGELEQRTARSHEIQPCPLDLTGPQDRSSSRWRSPLLLFAAIIALLALGLLVDSSQEPVQQLERSARPAFEASNEASNEDTLGGCSEPEGNCSQASGNQEESEASMSSTIETNEAAKPLASTNALPPTPSSADAAHPPIAPVSVKPERLSVRIESTPSGATIWRGDQALGTTPATLDFEPNQNVTLRLRKSGYEAHELQFVPTPESVRQPIIRKLTARPQPKPAEPERRRFTVVP